MAGLSVNNVCDQLDQFASSALNDTNLHDTSPSFSSQEPAQMLMNKITS